MKITNEDRPAVAALVGLVAALALMIVAPSFAAGKVTIDRGDAGRNDAGVDAGTPDIPDASTTTTKLERRIQLLERLVNVKTQVEESRGQPLKRFEVYWHSNPTAEVDGAIMVIDDGKVNSALIFMFSESRWTVIEDSFKMGAP